MRGLPRIPSDVYKLEQDWDVDDSILTTSFWLFNPGQPLTTQDQAGSILAGWFSTCLPEFLAIMHNGCQPTTCRLTAEGNTYIESAPPAVGTYSGGQAHNCALGIKWLMQGTGRRSWSLTYVPAVPDVFIANGWRLNESGWGNVLDSATHLLNNLNALAGTDVGPLVVGTVQRQRAGAPLPVAQFNPYFAAYPVAKLVTIRRRIPAHGAVSPAP